MKKVFFLVLSLAAALFVSCSNDDEPTMGETKEGYIEATSSTTWHYYSLSGNEIVGTGEETEEDNNSWFARTDWDFAVNRYSIRTNSGKATSVGAKGGVYTFDASKSFSSISSFPDGAVFTEDEVITSSGMGGATSIVKSKATVIIFKTNDDGSLVMPPIYLKAPVYLFRTADGNHYYKVEFTQYQNDKSVSGHVRFSLAEIIK
jgi:hypothetical protein